jgi:DNA-directed RNA polymerase specialized sigma24 family protein
VDERLSAYLREQWGHLVGLTRLLCPGVSEREAQETVLSALTRIGTRRLAADADVAVLALRAVVRAGISRSRRTPEAGAGLARIDISFVDEPSASSGEPGVAGLVRHALAELPARHRAALVLRCAEQSNEDLSAYLMSCSADDHRADAAKGLAELSSILAVDAKQATADGGASRTEGLLRATLRSAGSHSTPPGGDPVARLGRRVAWARHRRAGALVAAVVLLVALGVSVVHGSGGGPAAADPQQPAADRPISLPREPADFASGVAVGGGAIWTIESHPIRHAAISYLVRRDPASGSIQGRYLVPDPDDRIGYGLGKVWAWNDNVEYPTTAISTVDANGDVATVGSSPSIAIAGAAFADGRAWFSEPATNTVLAVRGGDLGTVARVTIAGARYLVPVSATSVLVSGTSGELRQLPGNRIVDPGDEPLTLLAPAASYGFWTAQDQRLSYRSGVGASPSLTVTMRSRVVAVSGDPTGGVYIALAPTHERGATPYLVYYSPLALRSSEPRPTAQVLGHTRVEGMVLDPVGGVVFTTSFGFVEMWRPPGAGAVVHPRPGIVMLR